MFNILIVRALSSWMLFDLVSATSQGGAPGLVTLPNKYSQPGGLPNALPTSNGLPTPNGLPNGHTLNTSLPYQCDTVGRQEAVIKLSHCKLALGQFFNYGQWVWSTDLEISQTCSSCRVVLESRSIYAIAFPAQALQKKVFDILSGCGSRAGLASLNQGVALPFGSYGPVTVRLQVAQGKKCRASQVPIDNDDDNDDDEDDDDDDFSTSANSTSSRAGSSFSSRPAADSTSSSSSSSGTKTTPFTPRASST